tara:strand:+ start:1757 stop:1909 length:153 start_codon:yes stop_codon:yes gene_type:complete
MTSEKDHESKCIDELKVIASQLNGTFSKVHRLNSAGRTSDAIIIEYNIKN